MGGPAQALAAGQPIQAPAGPKTAQKIYELEKTPENLINLTDALPISDESGKVLAGDNETFDFTVTATINDGGAGTEINYAIAATTEPGTTLTDQYVKVYLTDMDGDADTQILAPTKVSDLQKTTSDVSGAPDDQYLLKSDTFAANGSHDYRLRMWVADDYTVTGESQTYKLRVNVYGAADAQ